MKAYKVDLKTGFQGSIQLTPEQEAERLAEQQKWAENAPQRARDAVLRELRETDHELARVVEDLITTLASKGVISLPDLPPAVVKVLADRRVLRNRLV